MGQIYTHACKHSQHHKLPNLEQFVIVHLLTMSPAPRDDSMTSGDKTGVREWKSESPLTLHQTAKKDEGRRVKDV